MKYAKLTAVSLCLVFVFAKVALASDYYVSQSGKDANQGTQASPVASLAKVQSLARSLSGIESVTVHVADGVYYLPETLVFEQADSGSAEHPVVYVADNEGGAVLSGGTKLNLAWKPFRDGIFMAESPTGLTIDQLFVDGQNQRMARYPNFDASKKTEAYQGFAADAFAKERAARWANPVGGYIHAMHRSRWGGYHYQITGKNAAGEVTYEGGWQNNRKSGMHSEFRMVENIFEELDAPGEWFHDARTSTLYYMPASDVDLASATVEVVRLKHLIEFHGSEAAPVTNITLEGFTVRHAARTFMETKEQLLRSDWAIYRGGAFMLTGTEDIHIVDCEFDQVGGNAIFVNNYNRGTVVKGTYIHDTGASGVCFVGDPDAVRDPLFEYGQKNDLDKIDRTPGPKTKNFPSLGIVENCLIHGIGRVERQPAGVQIEMSQDITVRDCSIYDCARAGINIGDGAWGGHLIERCDVFDTVLETHDHGSFNSWGRDRYWRSDQGTPQKAVDADPNLPFLDAVKTTTIRYSRWRCDHGWDIDLDDGSSNYDIYNNLLLNTGLKLREGFRRHAWNNVIPFGGLHPHVWYDGSKDDVYSNIFAVAHRPARMSRPYVDGTMVDRNLFTTQDPSILKASRQLGWDEHSVLGDPMYVDPANGDFRVKDGSPALKLGFKNFPMDQFGVKKASLKAIAETPSIPELEAGGGSDAPVKTEPLAKADPVWLGATLHCIEGEEFSAFGTNEEDGGVALTNVPKMSAAAKAGLRENDLIQAVDGKPVATVEQLIGQLSKTKSASVKLKVIRDQQAREVTVERQAVVEIESSSSANGFKKLPLPSSTSAVITTNRKTGDDPINTLTDGKLGQGYGPVFTNGIRDGAYKMDLGSSKSIAAVTSWSFNKGGMRGAQKLTIYVSNATSDPGWDLTKFTAIGTIDTGKATADYTAASLRATEGKTLGEFRWIVWVVSPLTERGGGENTAFQEFAVEAAKPSAASSSQSALTPSGLWIDASLPINPAGINVLSGMLGDYETDFENVSMNHMNLWLQAKGNGRRQIQWKLQAPADGGYDVSAVVLGNGSSLVVSCNEEQQENVAADSLNWKRIQLGSVSLKAGENTLKLDMEAAQGFSLDALELVKPEVKAAQLKDALAMRQRPEWFADARYGLMFQWTNRATPPTGPNKPWEEKVNDFDLESFVEMVEDSGAAYVLWSITWGQQYISAPIKSLDGIIAGRTTKRDLLGEMADALAERDIKLIFYYHYGYDCNHSIDTQWMKASGGYKADKTELYRNWMAIISEIGDRYGDKLHGWWFDGGQRYYNCHFDNTPGDQGILSAPFKELTEAARIGNHKRVVAYNSWIKPRLTEYQDYYGGEGAHVASGLDKGVFQFGPQQGLLAHGCFILEKNWGHIELNSTIPNPSYTLEELTALIERAQNERFPLSINLEMYEDGSVSPESMSLLKQLRDSVRAK